MTVNMGGTESLGSAKLNARLRWPFCAAVPLLPLLVVLLKEGHVHARVCKLPQCHPSEASSHAGGNRCASCTSSGDGVTCGDLRLTSRAYNGRLQVFRPHLLAHHVAFDSELQLHVRSFGTAVQARAGCICWPPEVGQTAGPGFGNDHGFASTFNRRVETCSKRFKTLLACWLLSLSLSASIIPEKAAPTSLLLPLLVPLPPLPPFLLPGLMAPLFHDRRETTDICLAGAASANSSYKLFFLCRTRHCVTSAERSAVSRQRFPLNPC